MNEQNPKSANQIELIDNSDKSNSRVIRITISELIGDEKESVCVFSNLSLLKVLEIIQTRVNDQSNRLMLVDKISLFGKQLKEFKEQSARALDDYSVVLNEAESVKKVNDDLMKQIQNSKKEHLEFRESMIKKYEALEKSKNESEGN